MGLKSDPACLMGLRAARCQVLVAIVDETARGQSAALLQRRLESYEIFFRGRHARTLFAAQR